MPDSPSPQSRLRSASPRALRSWDRDRSAIHLCAQCGRRVEEFRSGWKRLGWQTLCSFCSRNTDLPVRVHFRGDVVRHSCGGCASHGEVREIPDDVIAAHFVVYGEYPSCQWALWEDWPDRECDRVPRYWSVSDRRDHYCFLDACPVRFYCSLEHSDSEHEGAVSRTVWSARRQSVAPASYRRELGAVVAEPQPRSFFADLGSLHRLPRSAAEAYRTVWGWDAMCEMDGSDARFWLPETRGVRLFCSAACWRDD